MVAHYGISKEPAGVGGPHGRKRPQVRRSVDPIGRKDRGEDAPDNKCLEAPKAFADALK